jgi:NADH-quinone oxidoreductase subunit F
MDLHIGTTAATAAEREAVDAVLGPADDGWSGGERGSGDGHVAFGGTAAARAQRHRLLPVLHVLQARAGWISPGGLAYACRRLTVPPAEAYGVATFYGLFSLTPRPGRVVHVCVDLACRAAGSDALCAALDPERTGDDDQWIAAPCLGLCERAPAALRTIAGESPAEDVIAPATVESVRAARRGEAVAPEPHVAAAVPQAGDASLVLLARVGQVDPTSLDEYRAHGGYAALRRALAIGPEAVIREVHDARLTGRGGAAFPAGRKWEAVARHPSHPHHLVCNADESEPGTFKDRVLMEGDPYAVVEAMTIAGAATGCEQGWIYIRGEYPAATERLRHAIDEARSRGFLGDNVMGSGLRFDIDVFRGAGAYICGEETAIFNSIEGFRGEPRNKPPYPTDVGLFGQPTLVNNVETLVNVLPIVLRGGDSFAATGTSGSTGTKLFAVSGRVRQPGVYEVPFGTTLRDLLHLAGGVPDGHELRSVLLGGAAGGFLRADEVDLPLTFEDTRAVGASLGSGVVMVLDDTVDVVPFLLRIAAFFRDESCGQCVPCRVGTVRQEEALRRLADGRPLDSRDEELARLADVGQVMRDASICGLGQTAWNAVESAITRLKVFS